MRRDAVLLHWAMLPATLVLLVLLAISLMNLGNARDAAADTRASVRLPSPPTAAEETRQLLAWLRQVPWRPFTNTSNPFFTLAIQPSTPAEPPQAKPTTLKLDVTYRGFMETSAGIRRALVQVADKQVLGGRGEKVVADYAVMEIELRHLTLTNAAGQQVRCEFSKAQSIEVTAP